MSGRKLLLDSSWGTLSQRFKVYTPFSPRVRDDRDPMKKLRNLGPISWRMLTRAGIKNVETLRAIGAPMAYVRVEMSGAQMSLNLLYAMAGGLEDKDWREITNAEKASLNLEVEDLRELLSADRNNADIEI